MDRARRRWSPRVGDVYGPLSESLVGIKEC